MRVEAENGPESVVGPVCEPGPDGTATLLRWMLEQHVGLCKKSGVDCRTCEKAGELGVARPA